MKNQVGKEKPNKKGKLLTTKATARPKMQGKNMKNQIRREKITNNQGCCKA